MKISVKSPSGKITVHEFTANSITIGSSEECDLAINVKSISSRHARIEVIKGDYFVTDLEGSNGVFIDGTKIPYRSQTKFDLLQTLLIGSLECQVEDSSSDEEANTVEINSLPETKKNQGLENKATVKLLNPDSLLNSFDKKSSTPSSKSTSVSTKKKINSSIVPFLALMIGGIVFFYFNSSGGQNVEENSADEQLLLSNIPVAFRDINDDFEKDYIAIYANIGCDNEARLCSEMNLSPQKGEGIAREDKNVFIFINPSAHLENKIFSRIKELSDATDLVSLYLLLNSSIMKDFDKKIVGQVHLILIDKAFKESKAFRFHPKYFAGNEITRMLSELGDVMDEGAKTDNFWNYVTPLIKTKNL